MKQLLSITCVLLLLLCTAISWKRAVLFSTQASHTFYFSASKGNDTYTSTQAQNPATPWKSLNKIKMYISNGTITAGDSILLKCGDKFIRDTMEVTTGVKFNSYGTGAQPEITGFYDVQTWTQVKGMRGVYESEAMPTGTTVNMVAINNKEYAMGRSPNATDANSGYLTFESHATGTITDNTKQSWLDNTWNTGAQLVVRTNHGAVERAPINDVTSTGNTTTISYSGSFIYGTPDRYGYFVQNDIRTLDQFGEWYYNPNTKKISVYFGNAGPGSNAVQVSAKNILIMIHASKINIKNLRIQGANQYCLYNITAGNNDLKVANCEINFSGIDAGCFAWVHRSVFENCVINYTNGCGLSLFYSDNSPIIRNCTIKNIGIFPGLITRDAGNKYATAIFNSADSLICQNNTITNVGYISINFTRCNNVLIQGNTIDSFCTTLDDGGAIYAYTGSDNKTYTNRRVLNNIILHGLGAPNGTAQTYPYGGAFYPDDNSTNILFDGNTIAYCKYPAVYIHNSRDITITHNTLYHNTTHLSFQHDKSGNPITECTIKHNEIVALDTNQLIVQQRSINNDFDAIGSFDSNYYWRPLNEKNIIVRTWFGQGDKYYNLDGNGNTSWQSVTGQDAHTKKGPANVTNPADIILQYNTGNAGKSIGSCTDCMGLDNIPLKSLVNVNPMSSVILVKKRAARQ